MKTQQLQHRKLINAARITILIRQLVTNKNISKKIGKPESDAAKQAKELLWWNISILRSTVKQLAADQSLTKRKLHHHSREESELLHVHPHGAV